MCDVYVSNPVFENSRQVTSGRYNKNTPKVDVEHTAKVTSIRMEAAAAA